MVGYFIFFLNMLTSALPVLYTSKRSSGKKGGAPSVFIVGEASEGRNTNTQLINKLNNLKLQHVNL